MQTTQTPKPIRTGDFMQAKDAGGGGWREAEHSPPPSASHPHLNLGVSLQPVLRFSSNVFQTTTHPQHCTRGGAVYWGTALQTGNTRVRFPTETFTDFILPAVLGPWETKSLTKMSTTDLPWEVKGGRGVGLTLPPFVDCLEVPGVSTSWNPYGPAFYVCVLTPSCCTGTLLRPRTPFYSHYWHMPLKRNVALPLCLPLHTHKYQQPQLST